MSGSRPSGPSPAGAALARALAQLGVTAAADPHQLTRAYWRRARRLHPDVNSDPEAAEQFEALCAAYRLVLEARAQGPSDSSLGRRSGAGMVDPRLAPVVCVETAGARSGALDFLAAVGAAATRPGTGVWLVAGPVHVDLSWDADMRRTWRDGQP